MIRPRDDVVHSRTQSTTTARRRHRRAAAEHPYAPARPGHAPLRRLAAELITEIRHVDRRIATATTEISTTVADSATTLTELRGIGDLRAMWRRAEQLAQDASVAPGGFSWAIRSTRVRIGGGMAGGLRSSRMGPAVRDQVGVPAQQGSGQNEAHRRGRSLLGAPSTARRARSALDRFYRHSTVIS